VVGAAPWRAMAVLDILTFQAFDVSVTKERGVAETRSRCAALIDGALDGERFVVMRCGRPVTSLVLALGEAASGWERTYRGPAAFGGFLADWPEFEETMAGVIASRASSGQRPVPALA